MDSRTERAPANARRGREEDRREVEFYVRAKTGPGKRDWTTVGVALKRRNDEPGFSIKLNTLPISNDKRFDKLTVLSIAPLIARAINEVFSDGSVTSLFDGQS